MKANVGRPLGWFEVLGSMCGSDSPLSSRCLSPGLPVPANTPGHKSHWQQVIARGGLHTPARSATSQKHTGVTRATKGSGAEHNSEVGHPAWVTIHWRDLFKELARTRAEWSLAWGRGRGQVG